MKTTINLAVLFVLLLAAVAGPVRAQVVFSAPVTLPAGGYPYGLFPADYNGDGHCDLAVTSIFEQTLCIYLNNGDGTFGAPLVNSTDTYPWSLFSADFDGDSDLDIVVVKGDRYDRGVSVFLNAGDATFGPRVDYPTEDYPYDVLSADFDNDGFNDIAVTHQYRDHVSVLLGKGDGTFLPAVTYTVGLMPMGVSAADFDNNGAVDLVVANRETHCVSILNNNGDGTFQPATNYPSGGFPRYLTAADFDNDGWPDFAVCCIDSWAGDGGVWIFFNDGTGAFQTPDVYDPGQTFDGIASDDFNADGAADLAIRGSDYLYFFVNNGDGSFATAVLVDGGSGYNPHTADLDGDDDQDVVLVDAVEVAVSILFNLTPPYSCCQLPGDANQDGQVDLLDIQYLNAHLYKEGPAPPCFEEADVNGDGEITNEDVSCIARFLFSSGTSCVFVGCP